MTEDYTDWTRYDLIAELERVKEQRDEKQRTIQRLNGAEHTLIQLAVHVKRALDKSDLQGLFDRWHDLPKWLRDKAQWRIERDIKYKAEFVEDRD